MLPLVHNLWCQQSLAISLFLLLPYLYLVMALSRAPHINFQYIFISKTTYDQSTQLYFIVTALHVSGRMSTIKAILFTSFIITKSHFQLCLQCIPQLSATLLVTSQSVFIIRGQPVYQGPTNYLP